MKRRILSLTLVFSIFVTLLSFLPIMAATEARGECGENLTWTLNDAGRLTIRGEGNMTSAPWLPSYAASITEVRVAAGVTSIQGEAFRGCQALTEADIADSVLSIGAMAFFNCTSLKSVHLPESMQTIGGNTFGYCSQLEEINIPDGVTVIGSDMFFRCLNLKTVTLPATIETIELRAFYACEKLESLELKEGLKSIGEQAFAFTSFTNLVIPESVTSIDSSAFNYNLDLVLNVYAGSYALEYAQKNNKAHVIIEREKTPAEKLCDLINAQIADAATVNVKKQSVTLLKDVRLTKTLEIPTGGVVSLDIGEFNIYGADDLNAINIPYEAAINVYGTGTIKGGNVTENGYNGGNGISTSGVLLIYGPTCIGGDALGGVGYAGAGVETFGAALTYFVEGFMQAGEGEYQKRVHFEELNFTVVKESDDGINYSVVANSLFSDKKYLKAVKISSDLSAPAKLAALMNEMQPGACSILGNKVTLNENFTCPRTIYIPTGEAIVLDFNGYTVTTFGFFEPFVVPEEAEITFKGRGVLTNKEKPSGLVGVGHAAALISNDGMLTIDGITVIGVDLNGISNDGELIVNSGRIKGCDSASGKDAIYNMGTITVHGGEIIGGNATGEGGDGGDGISGGTSGIHIDGNYPIKLNGGILCGGKGRGGGENGRAISKAFNVGEDCVGYESEDGTNYLYFKSASSEMQYVKIEKKPGGNTIIVQNVVREEGKVSFDLCLLAEEQIAGTIYAAVYDGERLSHIKLYEAEEEIPVAVDCLKGQSIKVFWWGENFLSKSSPASVQIP